MHFCEKRAGPAVTVSPLAGSGVSVSGVVSAAEGAPAQTEGRLPETPSVRTGENHYAGKYTDQAVGGEE